jgi:carbon monoxide dehydrogenase subunit G
MPRASSSVEVAAPPARVWEVITDLSTCDEWLVIHVGFPDGAPDALAEGTRYKQTVTLLGLSQDVSWTVTELSPERRLEFTGKGPAGTRLKAAYVLDGDGDATRLGYEGEFGGLALKPFGSKVQTEAKKAGDRSLEKLRDYLER